MDVSVVIATYNQCEYLPKAITSVLEQTVSQTSYEVIVINDGSTDQTSQYLNSLKSDIRVVERENRGLVASCNEALSLANGRYLARLDSDDYVVSDWLDRLLQIAFETPDCHCIVPDMYELFGTEKTIKKADIDNIYTLEACGTMFKTQAIRQVGGFRGLFWEEYDLYLRLQELGKFAHCPQPLYIYRKHSNNMTNSVTRRTEGWLELIDLWGAEKLKSAGYQAELYEILDTQ